MSVFGKKFVKKPTMVLSADHVGLSVDINQFVVSRIGGTSEKGRVAHVVVAGNGKEMVYLTLWLNEVLALGSKITPVPGATYYISKVEENTFTPNGATEPITRMEGTLSLGFSA